jgi:two-component system cell cycle sensor histidine kinase/response regulator CckA
MLQRKDGSTLWISMSSVHADLDGRPSVVSFFIDTTEKRLLEEERSKVQKLDAIGTLAGGIAHDFNNLLQGVFGYISLAKLARDDQEESLAALEKAELALHMSVRLTNQLLTFSKGGKPVKKALELRPVIENAVKFALSGSRTGYRIECSGDLRHVDADDGQIGQVIQNIVLNADQAMPDGGQVVVSAKNVLAPGPDTPPRLKSGHYVMIRIVDTGVGIPEQYRAKIFDPYFTTKEKGSGLGLATSYSIVKNHDGVIELLSEPGKGSEFVVYLPALEVARTRPPEARPLPEAQALRKGRVLVMDDDRIILDVAGQMLSRLGHAVEYAENGVQAIEKYSAAMQEGQPFDVVILDLTVRGGMGGAEAIGTLLALDPAVRAVVSSGYSDDPVTSRHRELGFKAFLKKPYNVKEMSDVIVHLLNS